MSAFEVRAEVDHQRLRDFLNVKPVKHPCAKLQLAVHERLASSEDPPQYIVYKLSDELHCGLYCLKDGELCRATAGSTLLKVFGALLGISALKINELAKALEAKKLIPQAEPDVFDGTANHHEIKFWHPVMPEHVTLSESLSGGAFPLADHEGAVWGIIRRHQNYRRVSFTLTPEAAAVPNALKVGRFHCSVPFLHSPCPMYRPRFVHYRKGRSLTSPDTVLLTDSLMTAKINWLEMDHCKRDSFDWVSWYTGDGWQSHTDFSCLKDKNVYYVLHEHSGLGSKQILGTADTVRKLVRDKVKSLSFVWFLPDRPASERPSGEGLNAPVLLSEEDFNRVKAEALAPASFTIQLPRPRAWLFHPLLRERSLTLLHGDRELARWFALSTAFSLAYGWRLLPVWPTGQPNQEANVLYLATQHGNSDSLLERLQLILRMTGASYPETTPYITSHGPALFPSAGGNLQHLHQASAKLFWLALEPDWFAPLKNPGMFQYVLNLIDKTLQDNPVRPGLIVIDGMPVKSPGGARDEQSRNLQNFLSQLQSRNCSLMVVARNSCSDKKLAGFRERFKPDTVGEITQCAAPWSRDLGALITFARDPALVDPSFPVHWELARNTDPPCWRQSVVPLSHPDRDLFIWQWHRQGYNSLQIAQMLNGIMPKPTKPATVRQVLSRIKRLNGQGKKREYSPKHADRVAAPPHR